MEPMEEISFCIFRIRREASLITHLHDRDFDKLVMYAELVPSCPNSGETTCEISTVEL